MPGLVVTGLLVASLGVMGTATSRAQQAPPIDSTVLVTGRIEVARSDDAVVSAATITVLADQATDRLTTRGAVFLLVETGTVALETDATVPGLDREGGVGGSSGAYRLTTGLRVTLPPGTTLRLRNADADPARVFLLTFVVD